MEKSTGKKQYTGLKQRDRFLGAKSLNTNLVQFLPQYYVIMAQFPTCTDVHLKWFVCKSCVPKTIIYESRVISFILYKLFLFSTVHWNSNRGKALLPSFIYSKLIFLNVELRLCFRPVPNTQKNEDWEFWMLFHFGLAFFHNSWTKWTIGILKLPLLL